MDQRTTELRGLSALQANHYQELLSSLEADLRVLRAYRIIRASDREGLGEGLEEEILVRHAEKLLAQDPLLAATLPEPTIGPAEQQVGPAEDQVKDRG